MFAGTQPVIGVTELAEQSFGIHCSGRALLTSIILCSCGEVSG